MARCEHRDWLNFCTAKAWSHGCAVTQLQKEKMLRTRIYKSCYYLLCLEKQRFDSSMWTAQNYWTVPCGQSASSLWMQPNTNKKLPWVSNVTAACPKDVLEFKFFWEPCCIIVVYRLLWTPYAVHSSRAPSQGYI